MKKTPVILGNAEPRGGPELAGVNVFVAHVLPWPLALGEVVALFHAFVTDTFVLVVGVLEGALHS